MNQQLYAQLTNELHAKLLREIAKIVETSTNHAISLIQSHHIACHTHSYISTTPNMYALPSTITSTPKSQIINDVISKRNHFIQDFPQKQLECQQFANEMIKQAAIMKQYYQSIKQKEKRQKEIREQKTELLRIELEKIKKENAEKSKAEKHEEFIANRNNRKEFISKFLNAKIPKRKLYHYSEIKEESSESINTKEAIDFQSLREKNRLITKQKETQINQNAMRAKHKNVFSIYHGSFENTTRELRSLRDSANSIKKQKINNIIRMKMFANVLRFKPVVSQIRKKVPANAKYERSCIKMPTQKILSRNICKSDDKPWKANMSTNAIEKVAEALPKIAKYKDYLSECRHSHAIQRDSSDKIRYDKVMKNPNLSAIEKYNYLKPLLETVEERAHIKESNIVASKGLDGNSFEDATNIYINAIKAKLSLLEEF